MTKKTKSDEQEPADPVPKKTGREIMLEDIGAIMDQKLLPIQADLSKIHETLSDAAIPAKEKDSEALAEEPAPPVQDQADGPEGIDQPQAPDADTDEPPVQEQVEATADQPEGEDHPGAPDDLEVTPPAEEPVPETDSEEPKDSKDKDPWKAYGF